MSVPRRTPFSVAGPIVGLERSVCAYAPSPEPVSAAVRLMLEGKYVSILGPRFCGKTSLIEEIVESLTEVSRGVLLCRVDFRSTRITSMGEFCQHIAASLAEVLRIAPADIRDLGSIAPAVMRSADLSLLLQRCLPPDNRLVIVLDHIESAKADVASSVLRWFRSLYEERTIHPAYSQVVLLSCGSLSLFKLTLGEDSPFYTTAILVRDLDENRTVSLVEIGFAMARVSLDPDAMTEILQMTSGDRYMTQRVCADALGAVGDVQNARISLETVTTVFSDLVQNPMADPCITESFRRIQADRAAQATVLAVVGASKVSYRDLATTIDIGVCELTGAVKTDTTMYLPRGPIYTKSIVRALVPFLDQKGMVLSAMKKAIEVRDDPGRRQVHTSLVESMLESMAAEFRESAYTALILSLLAEAVQSIGPDNMTSIQFGVLQSLLENKVILGMTKEQAVECVDVMEKAGLRVLPSYDAMRDYLAYLEKREDPKWMAEREGMYVCFAKQREVGFNQDEMALLAEVPAEFDSVPRFIARVLLHEEEEVIDMPSDVTCEDV